MRMSTGVPSASCATLPIRISGGAPYDGPEPPKLDVARYASSNFMTVDSPPRHGKTGWPHTSSPPKSVSTSAHCSSGEGGKEGGADGGGLGGGGNGSGGAGGDGGIREQCAESLVKIRFRPVQVPLPVYETLKVAST